MNKKFWGISLVILKLKLLKMISIINKDQITLSTSTLATTSTKSKRKVGWISADIHK